MCSNVTFHIQPHVYVIGGIECVRTTNDPTAMATGRFLIKHWSHTRNWTTSASHRPNILLFLKTETIISSTLQVVIFKDVSLQKYGTHFFFLPIKAACVPAYTVNKTPSWYTLQPFRYTLAKTAYDKFCQKINCFNYVLRSSSNWICL